MILFFRIMILLVAFSMSGSLYAQKINVDSLLAITNNPQSTSVELIQAHNRLSRYFLNNDTIRANIHLRRLDSIATDQKDTTAMIMAADLKMRKLSAKAKYKEGEAIVRRMLRLSTLMAKEGYISRSYNSLGVLKSMQYQNDSALFYFEKSYQAKLSQKVQDPESIVASLINLGFTAFKSSKFEESLSYFLNALSKAEERNLELRQSQIHSGLGNVYQELNKLEDSRIHLRKTLAYGTKANDHNAIGNSLHNLGMTYKVEEPDSAIYYYKKSLLSYQKTGNKDGIGLSAMNTGDALINDKRLTDALNYYLQAHKNYLSLGNRRRIIDSENRLAKAHFELGNYSKARSYMDDVLAYYDTNDELESSSKAYSLLSQISEKTGDINLALSSQRTHQLLKDSLNRLLYNKDVAEITTKYETEVKEAEIENQKVIIQRKVDQNKSILISSILGGLFLIVGIFALLQRFKKNKKIAEQKEVMQSQKIQQLEKEKKILSMNAMIEGQEAERSRIAKDLHDGLGGLLSTVKAHFSNIQSEIQKIEKINVYNRANELVDEACDEVRRISHNLMPGALRLEGLEAAVQHLGAEMNEAHPFSVNVETVSFDTRMEETKEVFVYRIIQEALNNIIKHAEAKRVLIQMSETTDEYHFIIEDDGKGFDPLQVESGLGLKSIQSRVDFLKGKLDIDTRVGVGTTLSFHITK